MIFSRKSLLLFSAAGIILFAVFSFSVAKEAWRQVDFDITVRLQDNIPRRLDGIFSYFSLLGSAEVTVGLALLLSLLYLLRKHFAKAAAWLMVIPASMVEVFGKLVLFHPGPPVIFHRSILPTTLPSFYVETDFSYPSGHLTRTVFLTVVILYLTFTSSRSLAAKAIVGSLLFTFAAMMALTRVYLGEHWLSDVLGGILLGSSFGLFASFLLGPAFKSGTSFWQRKGLR